MAGGGEAGVFAAELAACLAPEGAALIGPPDALALAPEVAGLLVVPVAAATGFRSLGCDCCSIRVDLVDGLELVLDRRHPPRRAVVLTHHDVAGATQTLLWHAEAFGRVGLDGVVATCDGLALSTRLATNSRLGDDDELATVATADVVAVSGCDLLSDVGRRRVRWALSGLNRVGPVVSPTRGLVSFRSLVGLDAWRGRLASPPAGPAPPRPGQPQTVVLEAAGPLDAEGAMGWLDELVDVHAPGLLRLQGELCLEHHDRGVDLVGVRSFVATSGGRGLPTTSSQVSLVGWDLDANELHARLRSLVPR